MEVDVSTATVSRLWRGLISSEAASVDADFAEGHDDAIRFLDSGGVI